MPEIRIRVTAGADLPAFAKVFDSVATLGMRAHAKVNGESKKSAAATAKDQQAALAAHMKTNAAMIAAAQKYRQSEEAHSAKVAQMHARTEALRTRAMQQESAKRTAIAKSEADTIQRHTETARRANERAQRAPLNQRQAGNERWQRARDFGSSVAGDVGRGARAVMGVAGGVARGLGTDVSLAGMTQRAVSTEAAAMRTTLSAFAAENAKRNARGEASIAPTPADVQNTLTGVHSAGDATSTPYANVAAGLEALQSKSAGLKDNLAMLKDIGDIANASGADFAQLAGAAGDISVALGDVPDKASKVAAALRLVATSGALGTLEIKDQAELLGKVMASVTRVGGNFQKDLGEAQAIAQMSRLGGASSPAEQAQTANALTRDLTKQANLRRYAKAEMPVFVPGSGNQKLRSVEDVIVSVFRETKGDIAKITSFFPNEASKRGVMGLHGTYREAGGGEAGINAIKAVFKTFKSEMSETDVKNSANLWEGSMGAKANAAQNKFDLAWADALTKLVPAMERMIPVTEKLIGGLGSLADYISNNVGTSIAIAAAASVTKAGIGAVLSSAIERAIKGGGAGGAAGGAAGGGMGNLGAGLSIAAASVAITAMGMVAIKSHFDAKDEAENKSRSDALQGATDKANTLVAYQRGQISEPEALERLEKNEADIEAKISSAEKFHDDDQFGGRTLRDSFNWVTGSGPSFDATKIDQANATNMDSLKADLQGVREAINSLKNGLRVTVDNMPAGGMNPPGYGVLLPPGGRTRDE